MNKATSKILMVELYPVESGECYNEMIQGVEAIKKQGYKCEYHRVT